MPKILHSTSSHSKFASADLYSGQISSDKQKAGIAISITDHYYPTEDTTMGSIERRRFHHSSGSRGDGFGLFVLPLEIRRQIYAHMTKLPRVDHLNTLCTCKRLHCEAMESFLSRPLNLLDQEELIFATSQRSQSALRYVQEVNLHLTEMDPERMMPFLAQVVLGMSKRAFPQPYDLETTRITSALQDLTGIRSFSLIELATLEKRPVPRMLLDNVLAWAAQHYSGLRHLRVDSSNVSLEPLALCRSLRSLRLAGFSQTQASQMAVIFPKLSELADLQIVVRRGQTRYFHCLDTKKSINSEALRLLRPLQTFSIHDSSDSSNVRGAFLTVNVLRAISEVHGSTLRQFCISSIAPLEHAVVNVLAETIHAMSQLHTLALTWPGMNATVLESLPTSIWSVEVLVSDQHHAAEMLDTLTSIRHELPRLRKIRFITSGPLPQAGVGHVDPNRSFETHPGDEDGGQKLNSPWTVTWGVWQPFPHE